MPLTDVAQVTISTTGSPVSRIGFGTPLIADPCLPWGASSDRVRTYTNLAGLVTDGFVAADGVYKAAAALLSAANPPPSFKVGRRANKPTQHWTITPVAQDNYKYQVAVNGTTVFFTSGAGATLAQIINGLKAAIDALGLALTTANTGPNTALTIVANTAGAWFRIACWDSLVPTKPHPYMTVLQDQADAGIAADLDAIYGVDTDWYCLLLTHTGKAEVVAAAAWIEAHDPHLFIADTQDTDTMNTAAPGTDVMGSIKTAGYVKTAVIRNADNGSFVGAGLAGARLPQDPGSENWAFVTVPGAVGETLTATQQTNLDNKNGNYYYTNAGASYTWKGKVASGDWIDTVRFRDWLKITMEEDILQKQLDLAAAGTKLPYDDTGIAAIQSVIIARLKKGIKAGGLVATPAPVVSVPLAANVSSADRNTRTLQGITFTAQLAGAINLVKITGVLS